MEAAYAYGRGGGLFSRVKKNALTERTDLNVADFLTLDESYVRTMLDEYAKDAVSEKTEPSVTEGTTTVTDDEGEERELKTLTVKLGSAGRDQHGRAVQGRAHRLCRREFRDAVCGGGGPAGGL